MTNFLGLTFIGSLLWDHRKVMESVDKSSWPKTEKGASENKLNYP
jgi:hypothetical protein